MAKYCYLVWGEDGQLTCTVDHRDPKNCDLYKKDEVMTVEDDKLIIFGWITTVLGIPKDADPTDYNKLTDRLYGLMEDKIARARIEELNHHFIPHGTSQLETVYYLPGKRISVWGTSDAREAYERRLAELKERTNYNG